MSSDTLVVPRAAFSIEDPWAFPSVCQPVRMRRATDGATPRLPTSVDYIVATRLDHDAPLYEEDVVEAFLAPESPQRYFELEVNPRGTTFDARIESPDGVRLTMLVDRRWDCDGLLTAVRTVVESDGAMSVDTVLRLPFASLDLTTPRSGQAWRGNFFRVDRHPRRGDEFSAWQPTMRSPADFHVTGAFGTLQFGE
jgi:hypothetical protein